MTDVEPPRRRGLGALFDVFRRTAAAAVEILEPETEATGELVTQARAFQGLRVEDVMQPRADIVAIERDVAFADLVARFVQAEHSRMPVYRETLDEPVGVVHVKDVFKLLARKTRRPKPEDQVLHGRHHLVREMLYVPPSMPAARLLTLMRAKHIHMALVIDEFGGADGLVTLEDLLETLVGEISDEHDEESDPEDAASHGGESSPAGGAWLSRWGAGSTFTGSLGGKGDQRVSVGTSLNSSSPDLPVQGGPPTPHRTPESAAFDLLVQQGVAQERRPIALPQAGLSSR